MVLRKDEGLSPYSSFDVAGNGLSPAVRDVEHLVLLLNIVVQEHLFVIALQENELTAFLAQLAEKFDNFPDFGPLST